MAIKQRVHRRAGEVYALSYEKGVVDEGQVITRNGQEFEVSAVKDDSKRQWAFVIEDEEVELS